MWSAGKGRMGSGYRLALIFIVMAFLVSLAESARKVTREDHKDPGLGAALGESQQAEGVQGESLSLFETYTESLKFVLEGMFGPDYLRVVSRSGDSEALPLCRENEQMVNKGCNVMMYSCSRHKNGKFSCYFYYWGFCRCSRPWGAKLLNYLIPPAYDCYPSAASEEDFSLALDSKGEEGGASSKGDFSGLSEDLEIPVGRCGVNIIFVAWVLLVLSFLSWVAYRVYGFGSYIKSQIALSSRKKR